MSQDPSSGGQAPGIEALQAVLPAIGEPETLRVQRRVLPPPGPGQAIVRMEATGVSFAEQQMRRGKYYDQPKFPFVPGYDLVGTVERLGVGNVEDKRELIGRRVAAVTKTGAWASHVAVDTADLVQVPDGLDPVHAETVIVNGVTAWRMLHRSARVNPGETIVVLGAAGGVGSLLVQLGREAEQQVIGVGSSGQQEAIAAMGATPLD